MSLAGTLITSRSQWRQERVRWEEQRARDQLHWSQQRESEAASRQYEQHRDKLDWERGRDDDQLRWLREQKLKCYMEIQTHLVAASELAANAVLAHAAEEPGYPRDVEMAIAQELRQGYQWAKALSIVCSKDVAAKMSDVCGELYFTLQALTWEGLKPGGMVRRPEESSLREWILSEVIDNLFARLTAELRADLDPN